MDKKEKLELRIEAIHRIIKGFGEDIDKIQAELEALKEPELANGDYGIWDAEASSEGESLVFIALELRGELHWFSDVAGTDLGLVDYKKLSDFTRLGNIFADLAMLSEPLEGEFGCKGSEGDKDLLNIGHTLLPDSPIFFSIENGKGIPHTTNAVHLTIDQAKEISNKLRRKIATLEAKGKNNG